MTTNQKQIDAFIARHRIGPECDRLDDMLDAFLDAMQAGLRGTAGALPMIPTFIDADQPLPRDRRVVAIDAGGTNLRVAGVSFDAASRACIAHYEKHRMPGLEHEIGRDAFFEQLVEYVMPFADYADAIGFCFSYPSEISPDRDGRLLHWTKEIKAPEVEGHYVGRHLRDGLAARGYNPRITVLNDTIATLLAGRTACPGIRYAGCVGFILGTGTNTAYVEHNTAIVKRTDLAPDGHQAINVESGSFAGVRQGDIDRAFDSTTKNPGRHALEKMVAGAYLGGLCLQVLQTAAREGLFSAPFAASVRRTDHLSGRDVDAIAGGAVGALRAGDAAVPEPNGDAGTAVALCRSVIARAAALTAVNISAAILRPFREEPPREPVCVNADGSTFYALPGFQDLVEEHMRRLLQPRGMAYQLVHVDNAPVLGAAIAGLLEP